MACALSALPPHPNNASFSPLHSAPPSARSSSSPPLKGARWPVPQTTRLAAPFFLSAPAQICPQPGLMRACRQTFLMAKPPLPCRKIFACACLPVLFAFSSPWFFSFPPFLSICFGQIHRFFIRKVLAAFHWCAAKPICLPRPFFMRRVLSSKPMPPCFPFSLIGLSQAYPLNHAAFRPLRRRFLFS